MRRIGRALRSLRWRLTLTYLLLIAVLRIARNGYLIDAGKAGARCWGWVCTRARWSAGSASSLGTW